MVTSEQLEFAKNQIAEERGSHLDGELFKEMRTTMRYTQQDLAAKFKVTRSVVSHWEECTTKVPSEVFNDLLEEYLIFTEYFERVAFCGGGYN